MRSRWAESRGSVTAEFAVALPVLIAVFGLCLNGLAAVGNRVLAIDQASQAARLIARGSEEASVAEVLGIRAWSIERADGLVCVTVQHTVGVFPVVARGCALDDGQ